MRSLHQRFSVSFSYPVHFTENIFASENPAFKNIFSNDGNTSRKIFFVVDEGVSDHHPHILDQIKKYCRAHNDMLQLCGSPMVVTGGEAAKNDVRLLEKILTEINNHGIDRHSYLVAVGGGAVLDMAGFAAAMAHRGVRHIRIPTTVLSQNDSGIGVKNGINAFGKKNFLGAFCPPFAVINDHTFLKTLSDRDWRSGIAEAVKVALIKDADFFYFIRDNVQKLNARDMNTMQKVIFRCADLHLQHISGGDPFELGSSRPLDFGHWASHKLEQLTNYNIRHGEGVAIGISLDAVYSHFKGWLAKEELQEILQLIHQLGFIQYLPEMSQKINDPENSDSLLSGLQEFREHLGGKLTVMLLQKIGKGKEVHEMDYELIREAVLFLKNCCAKKKASRLKI